MNTKLIGKNIDVTPAIKERSNALFEKLSKYEFLKDSANCTITIRVVRKDQIVEITVFDTKTIRVEKRAESLYDAFDMAEETLIRKLRKEKEKKLTNKRTCESHEYVETENLEEPAIVKEKQVFLRRISKADAIQEMFELDHDFHLFEDENTGNVCVVYRRKDGDCGMIYAV